MNESGRMHLEIPCQHIKTMLSTLLGLEKANEETLVGSENEVMDTGYSILHDNTIRKFFFPKTKKLAAQK